MSYPGFDRASFVPTRYSLGLNLECGQMSSSQWRQSLQPVLKAHFMELESVPADVSSHLPLAISRDSAWNLLWEGVCVHQGAVRLLVEARTRAANAYLSRFSDLVYTSVVNLVGRPVAVSTRRLRVGFLLETAGHPGNTESDNGSPRRRSWVIPTLIVHKPRAGRDESGWHATELDPAHQALLRNMLERDILGWAWEFGAQHPCLPARLEDRTPEKLAGSLEPFAQALGLKVTSYGRPMPIKDAITHGGKAISPYARLNVQFTTRENLTGMHAGKLQGLGYGRIWNRESLRLMALQYPSVHQVQE